MRSSYFLVVLAGCVTSNAGARGDSAGDAKSDTATARTLRILDGDSTTIADDWTATSAGYHFDVVTDGAPDKPWISSAHLVGAHSLAFRVPSDASGHKQRIEYKIAHASDPDGLHFDNARYFSFAFKLEPDPAPFLGSAIIWQAWQGYPWGPPASLKIVASNAAPYRLKLAIRNSTTGPDSTVPDLEVWSGAVVEPNRWYRVVVYIKPRHDETGDIALWLDGEKLVERTGELGYEPADVDGAYDGLDVKNGIYQPNANNGHTIYFDQILMLAP